MNIKIITNFGATFSETDNDRFLYIAKKMYQDNEIEIITSDFCHEKKSHRRHSEANWPFRITFLHELGYKKNVCVKRFASHFVWGVNVFKYLKQSAKPNVIYLAVPSLTAGLLTSIYCKKNNVKFVIDVQDLWPEAFKMVLNIPILSDTIFLPFKLMADYIYKTADDVVAVSQTYVDRALSVNHKVKNGHAVFLGTDFASFDEYAQSEVKYSKKNKLWLGYCGTLGSSYDITCVIDALSLLNNKGIVTPQFIIMGDGPLFDDFKQYAKDKNVDCIFTGRLPYNEMCALLAKCDIVVNPIAKGSAGSIINKHADYAMSGRPVINTQESIEYRRLVKAYDMGFNCKNGSAISIAKAIFKLANDESLREHMGQNAKKCAIEKFDRRNSYEDILRLLKN